MGKKKREHVVFDKMLIPKKTVPFKKVNMASKTKQYGYQAEGKKDQ